MIHFFQQSRHDLITKFPHIDRTDNNRESRTDPMPDLPHSLFCSACPDSFCVIAP